MRQVYEALKLFGHSQEVAIDLGVLRGFDYYTGVVFEGYAPGFGFPLCEGGRYDGLLANFGYDCPATGFAINVEHLMSICQHPLYTRAETLLVGQDMAKVIAKAKELRSQGIKVEIPLEPLTAAEGERYAAQRNITQVVDCN